MPYILSPFMPATSSWKCPDWSIVHSIHIIFHAAGANLRDPALDCPEGVLRLMRTPTGF
jgi:hypothetical protein